jgi:ATP-dependent DNA helicase RecQ
VNNNEVCKSVQLLSYFEEKDAKPCGICSVCIQGEKNISKNDIQTLKKRIIETLEHGDLSSRKIAELLACSENKINRVLQLLLEHGIISITKMNTYKLYHL